MGIEWAPTAARLGYASEEAMWEDLYVVRGLSVKKLATRLDVSRNSIRTALDRAHVGIRKRGGANNQKLEITPELIEEIKQTGIPAVAKRLKLSYTTVYKRIIKLPEFAAQPPDAPPADAEPELDLLEDPSLENSDDHD